jgi:hypothetical protein
VKILLLIVLVLLAALAVRWLVTARDQRPAEPLDDGNGGVGARVPFRPSGQVFRAIRASRPTQVRHPEQPPEPGSGPMLRP